MQTPEEDLRDRPVGELLKQLAQETATLVRQEIELAKAEVSQSAKKTGIGAGMFGAAGVAGLLALGALTACLILALNEWLDAWFAALILAAVWGAVAGVLAMRGKEKVQQATPPAPQTQETVKEDIQWAKTQTKSARR
jgi:nitrate/nitrite transporter NarK